MSASPIALSFCISCCNRLGQLKRTLGHNLAQLGPGLEISLVDYGSSDGMSEWVWAQFGNAIESGRLRFFEVKSRVHWSSPRAKNLAHRIARGNYLFNLDVDNFIDATDAALILKAASMGVPCHQSASPDDGSFRIGMPRKLFDQLGGYDEKLLPVTVQAMNLLERVKAVKVKVARVAGPRVPALSESFQEKMGQAWAEPLANEGAAQEAWEAMRYFNSALSQWRVRYDGPRIKGGFSSYRGLLNGLPISIDGFNVIRPDDATGW